MTLRLKLRQEEGTSREPAQVEVYENDKLVATVEATVEPKQGADGASLNLKMLAGSSPVSACCPGSSGRVRKSATKLLVGQEPSREDEVYD